MDTFYWVWLVFVATVAAVAVIDARQRVKEIQSELGDLRRTIESIRLKVDP